MLTQYLEKLPDGTKIYRNQRQEELIAFRQDHTQTLNNNSAENMENDADKQATNTFKRNVSEMLKLRVVDPRKRFDKKITSKQFYYFI